MRLDLRTEPQPRQGVPTCPKHLDAEAKREWKRMLNYLGTGLSPLPVDRAMLAAYCAAWSRWVAAEKKVQVTGEVLKSAEGGLYQNPYRGVANKALEQMYKFGSEFGLSPVIRARMGILAGKAAQTPADELESVLRVV